jgi:hypothetical protein
MDARRNMGAPSLPAATATHIRADHGSVAVNYAPRQRARTTTGSE